MTTELIVLLVTAVASGSVSGAAVTAVARRRVTESEAVSNIVESSNVLTNTVLSRLAIVEAKVEHLEQENLHLRAQLFRLGHEPQPFIPRKEGDK